MRLRGKRFSPTALCAVVLILGCGEDSTEPQTGSIDVSLTMTGVSPDANGCVVSVDGVDSRRLSDGERHVFGDLATGTHTVTIGDVASNCMVQGESFRSVLVSVKQTATVAFTLECLPPTGLEVSTTTAGSATDPDGYTVTLDGAATQLIGANDFAVFGDVAEGEHVVELTGVAENCTVIGGSRITVDFVATDEGIQIDFGVACPPFYDHILVSTWELYIMRPDGSNFLDLVPGPRGSGGWFRYPSWAPDATRIAFVRDDDIWVLNTAGMTTTRLTQGARAMHCSWSPDGTRIAYGTLGDASTGWGDIYVMNADGSDPVNLMPGPMRGADPAWSPDGSLITFWEQGSIWVMNADGSSPRELTDLWGREWDPAWSPDGRRIAFRGAGENSLFVIYAMDADGSNLTMLTEDVATDQAWDPTYSPDGTRIAFTGYRADEDRCSSIYVMQQDGSNPVRIWSGNLHGVQYCPEDPAWSPGQ